jgi:predicted GTPase
VVQAGTAPPTFVVFLSGGTLGGDYLRFLENRLREEADFTGNPLHILARAGERK